jgi:NAD(P)H-dependent flavin oxidoreductase YrpB (nitropropane dioxygenase family)
VHHALIAERMGVDAVTVFGSEGGGHVGDYGLTTLSLVPRAVDLLGAGELDTLLILGSVHSTLRVWKNKASEKAAELEASGADFAEIFKVVAGGVTREMLEGGDVESGIIVCSQDVGIVREIKPVKEIISGIAREAEAIAGRLAFGNLRDR